MSVKVFSKDGKPDRVVTTASQETSAVFDGFREVKAEDADKQKAPEELPLAELAAKAAKQDAEVTDPAVKAALGAKPKTN